MDERRKDEKANILDEAGVEKRIHDMMGTAI
jgi:hypothetical protein